MFEAATQWLIQLNATRCYEVEYYGVWNLPEAVWREREGGGNTQWESREEWQCQVPSQKNVITYGLASLAPKTS